jgi:hypothetical protein
MLPVCSAPLKSPIFIIDPELPGTFDFGTIDPSKHAGAITYIDVDTSNGFWEFAGSGYAIGNGSFTSYSINAMYVFNPRNA